jgi:hypothetical protein
MTEWVDNVHTYYTKTDARWYTSYDGQRLRFGKPKNVPNKHLKAIRGRYNLNLIMSKLFKPLYTVNN